MTNLITYTGAHPLACHYTPNQDDSTIITNPDGTQTVVQSASGKATAHAYSDCLASDYIDGYFEPTPPQSHAAPVSLVELVAGFGRDWDRIVLGK